jgi:hypothetical protein
MFPLLVRSAWRVRRLRTLKALAGIAGRSYTVEPIIHRAFWLDCVIHAISVHDFTACRSSISRDAGKGFHAMSVQFRLCVVKVCREIKRPNARAATRRAANGKA